jgi:hypothetical protein
MDAPMTGLVRVLPKLDYIELRQENAERGRWRVTAILPSPVNTVRKQSDGNFVVSS